MLQLLVAPASPDLPPAASVKQAQDVANLRHRRTMRGPALAADLPGLTDAGRRDPSRQPLQL